MSRDRHKNNGNATFSRERWFSLLLPTSAIDRHTSSNTTITTTWDDQIGHVPPGEMSNLRTQSSATTVRSLPSRTPSLTSSSWFLLKYQCMSPSKILISQFNAWNKTSLPRSSKPGALTQIEVEVESNIAQGAVQLEASNGKAARRLLGRGEGKALDTLELRTCSPVLACPESIFSKVAHSTASDRSSKSSSPSLTSCPGCHPRPIHPCQRRGRTCPP